MSHHHRHNFNKPCEAEAIANYIKGECEHVQKLHDNYGLGCIFHAKHSVVIREISVNPTFKKLILRVCDVHFEKMQHDDLLILADSNCCLGTDNTLRVNFRRNRL
jgi:hypothetical protein